MPTEQTQHETIVTSYGTRAELLAAIKAQPVGTQFGVWIDHAVYPADLPAGANRQTLVKIGRAEAMRLANECMYRHQIERGDRVRWSTYTSKTNSYHGFYLLT